MCKEKYEAFEIYPTEKGWIELEKILYELWGPTKIKFLNEKFEQHVSSNTNLKTNSYVLNYNFNIIEELFPKFIIKSEFCYKQPKRVESKMEKYLREKGITIGQFKRHIENIVDNESI